MKINRHNYEEFFLLYVDNELSSEDRRMVEEFVQLHPDLKEELELLSQFKFTPDSDIVFENKEELLKVNQPAGQVDGETTVSFHNYEELLLSYIDNELTAQQRTEAEQFVNANPAAKKELELLKQTKLQPETIVFTNKELLYRKEEKVRSLPVRWWRAAAAILILALGLTTALVLTNKSTDGEEPVAKNPGTQQPTPANNKIDQPVKEAMADNNNKIAPAKKEASTGKDNKQSAPPAYAQKTNVTEKENRQTQKIISPINNPLPAQKEEAVMATNNKKPSNNLPTPDNNPYVNGENPVVAKVNTPNEKTEIKNIPAVTNQPALPSNIIQASYNNSDEELVQNDGKKNKLRGLFRKAARTFEKRTDIDPTDDDNRLLVGGFSIKLK
jgi:hypothetical protein